MPRGDVAFSGLAPIGGRREPDEERNGGATRERVPRAGRDFFILVAGDGLDCAHHVHTPKNGKVSQGRREKAPNKCSFHSGPAR